MVGRAELAKNLSLRRVGVPRAQEGGLPALCVTPTHVQWTVDGQSGRTGKIAPSHVEEGHKQGEEQFQLKRAMAEQNALVALLIEGNYLL